MEKVTVLIAEDEAIVAMEVQNMLEGLDYSVIAIADTGQKVVENAIYLKPDIILMDIRLKGDMDGIEAAEKIRSTSEIPIIFVTAFAETAKLERAKLTLPYGYLLKPIQDRDLKVTLEMALYAAKIEAERKQTADSLQKLHDELEEKVKARTIDLKKAKEAAEAANRAKTDFLNDISHELRTPMHHILNFSKFGIRRAERSSVPDTDILDYFNHIWESGNGLLNLLNDLLDLSKLESGKIDYTMTPGSLADIAQRMINEYGPTLEEHNVCIELKNPEVPTILECDQYKIGQVIRNLLANAAKFSPAGGKITVDINEVSLIAGRWQGDDRSVAALCLTVSDQGSGIPEDELETIFERFVQSGKSKKGFRGTGLGLSICLEIIKAHHGKIWAENNQVGGSTFRVVLPITQGSL